MRDIGTIVRRILVDLPVTQEEADAARKHLDKCKKSQDNFYRYTFIFWGVVALALLAFKLWLMVGR